MLDFTVKLRPFEDSVRAGAARERTQPSGVHKHH